ncbi:MAG: hypothetical protein HN348_15880, partial [Proteobacteria bacterium]|nr:hypothetical protein [Pseudomonadota bacterium]
MKGSILAMMAALMFAGCGGSSDGPPRKAPVSDQAKPQADVVPDKEPTALVPQKKALSLQTLRPLIREVAQEGVAPTAVTVSFLMPVIERSKREITDKTLLEITPDVDGDLIWEHPARLKFEPTNGFAPGTKYTFHLASVDSFEGVLEAKDNTFDRSFQTPPFKFLRMDLVSVDPQHARAEVDLVFSGPVRKGKANIAFTASGSSVRAETRPSTRNKLRYRLTGDVLRQKGTIDVDMERGIASAAGATTLSGKRASLEFEPGGKPITIHVARRVEGNNAHFVEVLCNDDSVEGYRRYFWDNVGRQSYRLSPRCVVDEASAKEHIHFTPPVDFTISGNKGGFRIQGDFERNNYSLRIDAGAISVDAGMLAKTYETTFEVPALSPKVEFINKGRYLPKDAWDSLAVRHRNTDNIALTVRHIPRQNMMFWLTGDNEMADERTSNIVLDTLLPTSGEEDDFATTWLDLAAMLPNEGQGVYEIMLKGGYTADGMEIEEEADTGIMARRQAEEDDDKEGTWASTDVSRLLLTNLNLVVKAEALAPNSHWVPKIHVWALNMNTTHAVYGVEVDAVRPSGQVMATCTTDLTGGCVLELPDTGVDKTPPVALVATKGDDLTYLKFSELKTEIADDDVSGLPYLTIDAYRAAVYTDRGVYRPGDVAHISAIIRDRNQVAPPEGLPLLMKVTDPRGKLAKKVSLGSNKAGMISYDLKFEGFATTGGYGVTFEIAERVVGRTKISVEEFVPERMKVLASAEKESGYLVSEEIPVDVEARYLFGGSAEGSMVQLNCGLEPSLFKPKNNRQLHYGMRTIGYEKTQRAISLGDVSDELNAQGQARLFCPDLDEAGTFMGAGQLVAQAAVFEAGSGRTTVNETRVPVHPEKYYLGLEAGADQVEANAPFEVNGLVVDWEGNAVKTVKQVDVELYRLDSEWGWYWDDDRGTERYQRHLRPVLEGKDQVQVADGRFKITATPTASSAAFLVRVKSGRAQTDLRLEGKGRRYWWQPTEARVDLTPRPLKPTSLALDLPKKVEVGEDVVVSFIAPYPGRVLLTVESHELIRSEWFEVSEPGEVEWRFEVQEFAPNVYVGAFLVKDPH